MREIPQVSFLRSGKAQIGFEIFTLSSLFSRYDTLPHPLDKPHRVEFYAILFITKGTGIHHIDFHSYKYVKGSLLFISKSQVHAFEVHPAVDGFLILFTEDFLLKNLIHSDTLSFCRLYNYPLYAPVLQAEQIGESAFDNIVAEIYAEFYSSDNFAREEILRLLLQLLLTKVAREQQLLISQKTTSSSISIFSTFRDLIERRFRQTRNANEYAQMMDISYKHLNEICKMVAGNTAKGFIDAFLILETKRRLVVSDISIKELAYQLGFKEQTNFAKFFRKHTGQSPTQFRRAFT